MVNERHPEFLSGYFTKKIYPIQAEIPTPQGWFYSRATAHGTVSFALSRERPLFQTGLTVNVFPNAGKRLGVNPLELALKQVESNSILTPTSELATVKEGPFTIYQKFLHFKGGVILGVRRSPIDYYVESIGNDKTGTVYFVIFESPTEKWGEDKQIAETMIKGKKLNPDY